MPGDDFSELHELVADLEDAPVTLPKYLRKALEVTSRNVKDSAAAKIRKRAKPWRHAAASIDYELEGWSGSTSGMTAEVGYNESKGAGQLGNLLEFGAPNAKKHILVDRAGRKRAVKVRPEQPMPLAPGGELQAALNENEDDFERGIDRAVADAMEANRL